MKAYVLVDFNIAEVIQCNVAKVAQSNVAYMITLT